MGGWGSPGFQAAEVYAAARLPACLQRGNGSPKNGRCCTPGTQSKRNRSDTASLDAKHPSMPVQ
eukprot:365800-Chlamydomonas_euryale.AAC.14